jgi:hypothetical protein
MILSYSALSAKALRQLTGQANSTG